MDVKPTNDCRTEYHGGSNLGQVGLCWAVTLANESENRLSIVDQRVFNIQDGHMGWFGGFQNMANLSTRRSHSPAVMRGSSS